MTYNSSPKILFFGTPAGVDYQSDCLFHGLRELLGESVVDADRINYMYDDVNPAGKSSMYGMGFTLPGRLSSTVLIDRTDIVNKIKNKYFDFVMFGATHRNDSMYLVNEVLANYEPNKIVFINGYDAYNGTPDHNPPPYKGIHFVRERYVDDDTLPISVSTPKENVVKHVPTKTRNLMPIIPGVPWFSKSRETYVYNTEQEYYDAYKESFFGLTWKKAGWEALRHYEILSQGCVPLFLDIAHIPTTTLIHFPKKQVERVLDVAVKIKNYSKTMEFEYHGCTIQNIDFFTDIQFNNPESYGYYDIANELLEYTRTYLTTEFTAKYVLDSINTLQ